MLLKSEIIPRCSEKCLIITQSIDLTNIFFKLSQILTACVETTQIYIFYVSNFCLSDIEMALISIENSFCVFEILEQN